MKTAVKPDGNGTEENPYQITSLENLLWLGDEAEKHKTNGKFYKMMNDIDASETRYWQNGAGFIPIGKNGSLFRGTFDGNGKKITDLYINRASDSRSLCIGLFGYIDRATIKNLQLKNANISSSVCGSNKCFIDNWVGGLVGYNYCGTISGCHIHVDIKGSGDAPMHIGGLVGKNNEGNINNCTVLGGTIETNGSNQVFVFVGGIVGYNSENGVIRNCESTIHTAVNKSIYAFIGKLVGFNDTAGTITKCIAYGGANGSNNDCVNIGGLVGENHGNITDCTYFGTVTGVNNLLSRIGGLIGLNESGNIVNCVGSGNVSGTGVKESRRTSCTYVGGLAGENNNNGHFINCMTTVKVTGTIENGVKSYINELIGQNYGTIEKALAE